MLRAHVVGGADDTNCHSRESSVRCHFHSHYNNSTLGNSGFYHMWVDHIGPNACLMRLHSPPFEPTLIVQAASLERRDLVPHL